MQPEIAQPELVHRHADLDGLRLHYVEAGPADAPVVVLLHGFPEFWWSWAPQMGPLVEAGFRVIVPDQRGYHLSDKPRRVRDYRVSKLTGDVVALLDHLGVERCHLVGHDWGGMVAWMTANDHPERIERLVVCSCPHPKRMAEGLRTPRQLAKSWYIFWFQLPGVADRALAASDFAPIRRMIRRDALRPERWPPDAPDRYAAALRPPGSLTAALNWYRAAFRRAPWLLRRLRPIRLPTLVVWGRHDRYLGVELADPPPHLVPDNRTVVFEASHWLQHDADAELSELLVSWLTEEATPETP